MSGFNKGGAQAVYINEVNPGSFDGVSVPIDNTLVSQGDYVDLLTAVVFNNVITTQDSGVINVEGYRRALVLIDIDSTLAPTNITFTPQFTENGGATWWDFQEGIWASMVFEDTATASGINKVFKLDISGTDKWQISVVATGTDATNFFTVTVKTRAYR